MALRVAHVPLESSVEALSRHIAHLQEDGRWVLVITNRLPAELLVQQLGAIDWSRIAFIDTNAPRPGAAPARDGIPIDHIAGPHLVELLHLRIRRLVQRLPQAPHMIFYDAQTFGASMPRHALEEMTRNLARVSLQGTWTDIIVHDRPALPGWQRTLYEDLVPHRCEACNDLLLA